MTCAFPQQDEQYSHLDELEVTRVDKQVNDAMVWMNSKMNQQNSQDLTLEPVVKVQEIQAKMKVRRVQLRRIRPWKYWWRKNVHFSLQQ